jgi:transposase-like protein
MGDIRKSHPPNLKSKIAAKAISGEKTLAELSSQFGVHQTLICKWKKEALEALEERFSSRKQRSKNRANPSLEEAMAIIGKKEVELNYLKKKLGMLT